MEKGKQIKSEELELTPLEEVAYRKGRTSNFLAVLALCSVVVLILATTVIGAFVDTENSKEVVNLAFVAIGTYTGGIVKDITRAFWESKTEEEDE